MCSRLLKKSVFSPAHPKRAKTRFSPSIVLASLLKPVKRRTRMEGSLRYGNGVRLGGLRVGGVCQGLFEQPAGLVGAARTTYALCFRKSLNWSSMLCV